MIENVEKFSAKLGAEAFAEFPILRDRKVPVPVARIAENVAASGAKSSGGRSQQNGISFNVTPEGEIRSRMADASCGQCGNYRTAATARRGRCSRAEERDRVGTAGEVAGVPEEIPRLAKAIEFGDLAVAGEGIGCVSRAPGKSALDGHTGIDGPSL